VSEVPAHDPEAPSESLARLVDQVCNRFEAAWKAGGRPRLEDFLGDLPEPGRAALLRELIALDVYYRRARGEDCRPEEYQVRFPTLDAAWLAETLSEAAPEVASPSQARDPASADSARVEVARETPMSFGDYELLAKLGEGGMGTVYRARHRRLGRDVALKRLRRRDADGRGLAARFEREMRAVGRLDHPHVVEAQHAGEYEGQLFLVMKLLDGLDLARLMRRIGPLRPADACEAVRQAAVGLQYVHEQGLVHRDLKPSNLMLTRQGVIKILDLGLARLTGPGPDEPELTGPGMTPGTVGYMAPEQQGDPAGVTIAADLYGLGCVLFHLLAGRPPFAQHAETLDKLVAHRFEPPPDLRALRPGLPEEVVRVVERLLAKNPADRFAEPRDVAAALASPAAGADLAALLGTAARRPDAPPAAVPTASARPRRPRRRWLVAAAAVLGVAAVLLGVLGLAAALTWRHRAAAVPLDGSIDVLLWPERDLGRRNLRLQDAGALPLRPGDAFAVEAELNRPAYLYVLWIDTDGQVQPVYPWRPGRWEERPAGEQPVARLRRPEALDDFFPIEAGTPGMHTLVLLAREAPLPADVDLRAELGDLGRQTAQDVRAAVWFKNGEVVRHGRERGPAFSDAHNTDDPVLRAQQRLRELQRRHDFIYMWAVSFADRGQ
jgi:hypothetical protein